MNKKKELTHGSVFSGIGGPEVAAAMLGWENLFHCEINPFGRTVLEYHFPNAKSYEDITKTDFTEWRGRINVLTGGFPCQPFSYAGQRRGAEDDRYLWPEMFRCIDEIRPDWVVAENVAGILTMVEQGEVSEMASETSLFNPSDVFHRYKLRETFTLERICRDLESHGYAVQPVLIPACAVAAPHRRDRVFTIGQRITSDTVKPRTEGVRQTRCNTIHRPLATADTDGWRGVEVEESAGLQQPDGYGAECDGRERPTAKTVPEDPLRLRCSELPNEEQGSERHVGDAGARGDQRLRIGASWIEDARNVGERWATFPTQSPVHRGNDGIPFRVDNLTIPFTKWCTESLKAYGNAIVPQVMYEIFRAIEMTYL